MIPNVGQARLLTELHEGHSGISRMKTLVRTVMWWPGIDHDIENIVNKCSDCQLVRPAPPAAPLQPLTWPAWAWSRLHLDFAGPFLNYMFLVMIDAHMKWLEAIPICGATSQLTIQQLQTIFTHFGLPDTVVTDNDTCFVSIEFEQFLSENGIHHWKTAPYHPASNSLAERAMQILKQRLKKIKNGSMEERLAKILFNYRITPQSTTGTSPAQLLFACNLKSCLDLLKPNNSGRVEYKQQMQKSVHDRHAKTRYFVEGDEVYSHNFRQHPLRLAGKIVKTTGPLSFEIEL